VRNGHVIFAGICQVDDSLCAVRELRPITSVVCRDTDRPLLQRMLNLNEQVIKTLGLEQGCTHCEFLIPDDDTVLFGEICARVGGGVSELYREAYGIELTEQWLCMEAGEEPDVTPTHDLYASSTMFLCKQGVLRAIADTEQFNQDWIRGWRAVTTKIGDTISFPGLDYGVLAIFPIVAPDEKTIYERIDFVLKAFQFEVV
jgi:biotin carboxylase